MKLYTLIRFSYLVLGVMCLLGVPFERLDGVQVLAKLYGAFVCFVFIGLDMIPQKTIGRNINTIFLLSVAATMLFPFTVLSVWPELYLKAGTAHAMGKYMVGIPLLVHFKMLSYILALGIGFSLIVRILEGLIRCNHEQSLRAEHRDIFHRYYVWACLAITANIAAMVFARMTGLNTHDSTAGDLAFISRLLTPEFLAFVCFYTFIKYRENFTPMHYILLGILTAVFFLRGFLVGERGVVIRLPYWLILMSFFVDVNFRLKRRHLLSGVLAVVFLLPVFFTAVSVYKDIWLDDDVYKEAFSMGRVVGTLFNGDVYFRLFGWLGGRFSGYQVLVASEMEFHSSILSYANPILVFKSTVSAIFPNSLLPASFQTLSLGQIAAMVLAGVNPLEVKHASNFFGVTMLWMFMRYSIFPVLLFMVGGGFILYNRGVGRSDFVSCIFCFFSILIFQLMLSGNVDVIIGGAVTSIGIATVVWLALRFFLGKGRRIHR